MVSRLTCADVLEEAEDEDWDDDSRTAPESTILARVFKRMPYVIPFMTRVHAFRRLVAGHSLYSQVRLGEEQRVVALCECLARPSLVVARHCDNPLLCRRCAASTAFAGKFLRLSAGRFFRTPLQSSAHRSRMCRCASLAWAFK